MICRRVLCAVSRTQWHSESTNPDRADNPKDMHLRVGQIWGFSNDGVLVESDRRLFDSPADQTQILPEHILSVYGLYEEVIREMLSSMDTADPMLEWAIERIVRMTKAVFTSGPHIHLWCVAVDGFKHYTFTSDLVVPEADCLPTQCHASIGSAVASMYMTVMERNVASAISQRKYAFSFAEGALHKLVQAEESDSITGAVNSNLRTQIAALELIVECRDMAVRELRTKLGLQT